MAQVAVLLRMEDAKSRLSPFFSSEERNLLASFMFIHVLSAVEDLPVTVLTSRYAAADPCMDRAGNINSSISRFLSTQDEDVIIIPSDLPFLDRDDIGALVGDGTTLSLAPSQNGGTSGVYVPCNTAFVPRFGPGSHRAHLRDAHIRGIAPRIVDLEGFRDLDTVDDIAWIQAHRPHSAVSTVIDAIIERRCSDVALDGHDLKHV